jgi:hypothetical protein
LAAASIMLQSLQLRWAGRVQVNSNEQGQQYQ